MDIMSCSNFFSYPIHQQPLWSYTIPGPSNVWQAVTDAGLRVPEDIAIIGADNLRESQMTEPPLTTIHPPFAEIGRRAMESLLLRLADENTPPPRLTLPANLVVRQSTIGKPP